jgi:hypothetical protein
MTGKCPEYRRRNDPVQPPRDPSLGHGRRAGDRLFVGREPGGGPPEKFNAVIRQRHITIE